MSGFYRHKDKPHAVVAEFDTPDDLLRAAERTHAAGYRKIEAYSPFPIHGLSEAIDFKDQRVPWVVFLGGFTGMVCGFALQYYTAVWDYPLNIGGRPLMSFPQMVPVTFECTILFASLGAFLGMLGMNLLPQPYHPIFNTPNFDRASQDKFFLAVEANDPKFDPKELEKFLGGLNATNVSMVEG